MYRIVFAFVPFIFAASTASVPVFALDHRDTVTAGLCKVGGCMDYPASPARGDQIGFAKVTGSDPLGMGEVIDFNSTRVDSPCTAPRWSAWPVADISASKFDDARRRQNGPGADLQRIVADTGRRRGFSEAGVAGPRKLENVPIVRDIAANAQYSQEQWMRLPDRTIPEPGAWAVLIAGLLGICAVARPRIFSS